MTSLDDLSNLAVSVPSRIETLSRDLTNVAAVANLVEYDASLAAMLRLSDDIGIMANRIGEEADQILSMADNIGMQADQILLTQQQQSLNVAATQAALISTQELMIGLIVTYGL